MVVGEYIRTPKGIGKITNIYTGHNKQEDSGFCIDSCKDKFYCGRSAMKKLKSSPNIIDLIEVGDYVNDIKINCKPKGIPTAFVYKHYLNDEIEEIKVEFLNGDIKSIVTKEMYSSVEYRVENN